MNFPLVQLILFVFVALDSACQADNESSNRSNGFGYELLLEKIECLENTLQKTQAAAMKHEETILQELQDFKDIFSSINSCREAPTGKSGIYKLKVMNTAFDVYCEQNLYGGGWIVVQSRFDGSVDFYRHWIDYRNGFGSLKGEFWIGLEKIYSLTSSRTYELMIHLEDFDGVVKYAHYEKFEIGGEQEEYKLRDTLDAYDGTAGNSLRRHYSDRFSTRDRDNDQVSSNNLANQYRTGWWTYNEALFETNLNGEYANKEDANAMHWSGFNGNRQGLKVSKMMIREREASK